MQIFQKQGKDASMEDRVRILGQALAAADTDAKSTNFPIVETNIHYVAVKI